ncbi:MAG: TetR/AcrR family transcriptional regulator [Methanobacterium sp.]
MTGNKDNLTMKIEKNTKERIFDAAIKLFAQYGFEGTSMREIAEEVGIKKASMYSHFKSKDEILDKIMDYPTARIGMVGPQGIETEELIVSMGVENFMKMAIDVVTDWMKDPYMEKIWRIICIELYHNEQIKKFYSQFTENALSFWRCNFEIMKKHKLIKPSDPGILAIEYLSFYGNAYMDYFILRYGETTGSFLEEYHEGIRQHTEFMVNAIKP